MVFGNAGGQSGAGVGFTRDPASGEPALWVDFLFNAQGEDVVSGRRSANGHEELATVLPEVWHELSEAAQQLEHAFGDMQDFEFTVQDGRLFMLQTRSGKRTPHAAARIALDLLDEGLIGPQLALERTAGLDRESLAQPCVVAPGGTVLTPLGRAATASSGVAVGEVALDEARAVARHEAGVPVVLVRRDAETRDIAALESATGLLTQRGARTSHAAVVARQLGKVCLVGCTELQIDEAARTLQVGATTLHEGDLITPRRQRRGLLRRRCSGRDQVSGGTARTSGRAQAARTKRLTRQGPGRRVHRRQAYVVVAGGLALWFGWNWLDPVVSLVIAAVIVWGTWSLFRQSLHLLFDGVLRKRGSARGALAAAGPARRGAGARPACLGHGHAKSGAR
jgi:phosphohistidine swiveling domain-containing protein